MLAGTIGLAGEGETIALRLALGRAATRAMLCLSIDRPAAIDGLDEAALLDPGYSPDGDWPGAPALGLGFALQAGPQPRRGGRRRARHRPPTASRSTLPPRTAPAGAGEPQSEGAG